LKQWEYVGVHMSVPEGAQNSSGVLNGGM